jgi:hypothetical protein
MPKKPEEKASVQIPDLRYRAADVYVDLMLATFNE